MTAIQNDCKPIKPTFNLRLGVSVIYLVIHPTYDPWPQHSKITNLNTPKRTMASANLGVDSAVVILSF